MTQRWVFTELRDGRSPSWTWSQRTLNGQVERTSRPFSGYAEVIMDAIANGFRPRNEGWIVAGANGTSTVFNAEPPAPAVNPNNAPVPEAVEPLKAATAPGIGRNLKGPVNPG